MAELMSEVCHDVSKEPSLQPLIGDLLSLCTCNWDDGAWWTIVAIFMHQTICIIYNQMVNTAFKSSLAKPNINHHTVGRETNSAQPCDDRMVIITAAVLLRCTLIAIF